MMMEMEFTMMMRIMTEMVLTIDEDDDGDDVLDGDEDDGEVMDWEDGGGGDGEAGDGDPGTGTDTTTASLEGARLRQRPAVSPRDAAAQRLLRQGALPDDVRAMLARRLGLAHDGGEPGGDRLHEIAVHGGAGAVRQDKDRGGVRGSVEQVGHGPRSERLRIRRLWLTLS